MYDHMNVYMYIYIYLCDIICIYIYDTIYQYIILFIFILYIYDILCTSIGKSIYIYIYSNQKKDRKGYPGCFVHDAHFPIGFLSCTRRSKNLVPPEGQLSADVDMDGVTLW